LMDVAAKTANILKCGKTLHSIANKTSIFWRKDF
jgi:hypothetical protein